ncbi:hypothetical protein OEZ86_004647 [Tetradesmus obliquus]|nr:hypothetical protein OEZ86_004647 [Tetradesmus obliquus]
MEVDNQPQQDSFDLEAYISNYTSHTKIYRLLFIAERNQGKPLELEALKLAADEVKQSLRETFNTAKCEEVLERINGRLGPEYDVDRQLLESVDLAAAQKQERLESELHSHKTNLIKESIRLGHNDLGDFFYNRGDLQNAFKSYVRTRDYCTTPKHIITMCLNAVRVAAEMGNFMHVSNYVSKAEQTPGTKADAVTAAKLKAAAGLAYLDNRRYKLAARAFVEVSPELGTSYSDVISSADVALYGGLCALASFDRSELRSQVINNIGFREFMELYPEVREIVNDFHNSRYATCFAALEALRPAIACDIHLHDHAAALYRQVRTKALVQYVAPFSSVDLAKMAAAFNSSVSSLEKELAGLIVEGQVSARIDSQAKVLYARHQDIRAATFAKVLSVSEAYVRESKALLLRASLLKHDIVQRAAGGGGGGGGGGPGPAGGGGGGGRKGDGGHGGSRRAGDRMGRFGGHGGLGAAFSRAAAADMQD